MSALTIRLFGKFSVQTDNRVLSGFDAAKIRELLCYLLVWRDRPHLREVLAGTLWGDSPAEQSKKYLRQALWQLQATLDQQTHPVSIHLLLLEPEWIQFNPKVDLWLDVSIFEDVFAHVQGMAVQNLDSNSIKSLEDAVQLYRGDLLEGCYHDWCLYERERYQNMYFAMLDKLIGYCEAHGDYESGVNYGLIILRHDCARERTHQHLMRLNYLAGDRAAALRQYERCVAALSEELGVTPSRSTTILYEQIRADRLEVLLTPSPSVQEPATLLQVLSHLKQVQITLIDLHQDVVRDIQTIEQALDTQK